MEISEAERLEIFELRKSGWSLRKIGSKFGVSKDTIDRVLKAVSIDTSIRDICPWRRFCNKLNCDDCKSKEFVLRNKKIGDETQAFIKQHVEEQKAKSRRYLAFRERILRQKKEVITKKEESYEGYVEENEEVE